MEKHGKICIIMANMTDDFRDEYVVGMEKQANRLGYATYVFSMPLLDELHLNNEDAIYELIDFEDYDGVIFFEDSFSAQKGLGTQIEKNIQEKCQKPVVVLGDSLNYAETLFDDNSTGCEMLTDHMIEKHDCALLYFLGGQPGQISKNDLGFIRSLEKHGLPCTDENMIYGGYWMECGENLAKDIAYHTVEMPDAVICQDDTVALFFIKALTKYGIRVPEDIKVAGYGTRNDSRNNILSITTFPSNAQYTGRLAMAKLHALISGCPVPPVAMPKSDVIPGMSCGCGDCKPDDIRMLLEKHEKQRMQNIFFNNSQLEEKLIDCREYKELFPVIFHSSYLLSDKNFLAINTKEDETTSRCIYLRNHMWEDNPLLFKSTKLFPEHLVKNNELRNVHILPITYKEVFLGHFVIGYKEALVYNKITKKYINRLAFALWQIRHRTTSIASTLADDAVPQQTHADRQPTENTDSSADTLFVQKENTMHKIAIDTILFFETENRKTMAVLKNGRYEVKKNLIQLEELLVNKNFMRISKSTLLNLSKVTSVAPDADRTLSATLVGKITVRISRKNANEFKERIHLT